MALLQDFRYGFRTLIQSPVATLVAVLALALGIGVNISSFVAVNAMVLHPFPFAHLDRIMTVWESGTKTPGVREAVSAANYLDWKKQSVSFSAMAGYRGWAASVTGSKDAVSVRAAQVSAEFFQVVGMTAMLGRTFTAEDEQTAHPLPVVVSEGFWRQQLGGKADVIGRQIALDGHNHTVVGVMPAIFDFPLSNEVWAPLILTPHEKSDRAERSLQVIGLLHENLSAQQAAAEADELARRLQRGYPETNAGRSLQVLPILSVINEDTDKFLFLLLCAASMVLLLACANVMNLQLARAAQREKEIAVRAALGASRFQIARQLAAESLLMAIAGGLFALFLASWSLDFSKARIPAEAFAVAPGLRTMQVDATVIGYAFAISILSGLLACAPAIYRLLKHRSLTDLSEALQAVGRTSAASYSPGRNRVQAALIVFEVAMAMVLLVGATLMVKGFNGLLRGRYGYEARSVLRLEISLPAVKYQPGSPVIQFYDRALENLGAMPGVQAALWSRGPAVPLTIEGRATVEPGESRQEMDAVSSDFLKAMQVPLMAGRFLSEHDRPNTRPVAVISAAVARQFWPAADPVGQRVRLGGPASPWVTVVGVSGDVVLNWLTKEPAHLIYVPDTQAPMAATTLVMRTAGDPQFLAPVVREKVR